MAAAIDIIKRAMRLSRVYDIGEEPSSDEAQDCFDALNAMLDSWSTERLMVYVNTTVDVSFGVGVSSKTVGPSGDVIAARPVQVTDATYITCNAVDYPIRLITQDEYNDLPLKTIQGVPTFLYVDTSMPNVTLKLFPVPSQDVTLHLVSQNTLTEFPDLTTDVAFPPGYEKALSYSLAQEIAPEFGVQLDPQVVKTAYTARKKIKRINTVVPVLDSPADIVKQRYYIGFGFI